MKYLFDNFDCVLTTISHKNLLLFFYSSLKECSISLKTNTLNFLLYLKHLQGNKNENYNNPSLALYFALSSKPKPSSLTFHSKGKGAFSRLTPNGTGHGPNGMIRKGYIPVLDDQGVWVRKRTCGEEPPKEVC